MNNFHRLLDSVELANEHAVRQIMLQTIPSPTANKNPIACSGHNLSLGNELSITHHHHTEAQP